MSLTIGVVMDPITRINIKKDSTFRMLLEAQLRNHQIFYMEMGDLLLRDGRPFAICKPIQVYDDASHWVELGAPEEIDMADLDIVLMRKDPPFNMSYIYATYLLELAAKEGTLVVNNPSSLRDCNEKLYTAWFPHLCPATLVSSRAEIIKDFIEHHHDIILKPLDGMGGASIFRVQAHDPNISVIIETLTQHGRELTMAQKFIPEISAGDKRILMVDGEAIPYCLARIPAEGETRGNLAAGGRGAAQPLSDSDKAIAQAIGPELKRRGLYFVGLDVIGKYVTEINVTSPTCMREIEAAYHINIAEQLFIALENKVMEMNQ